MALHLMSLDELKERKARLVAQIAAAPLMSFERSNCVYLLGLVGEEIVERLGK